MIEALYHNHPVVFFVLLGLFLSAVNITVKELLS